MKRKHGKLTEEELKLMEKMDRFTELANSDPEVANTPVPPSLRKELFTSIREYEAEKAQKEQAEREKELVRLGLIYEKKRKRRKYYLVAAVAILVMAFGITSVGGPEKVAEMFKIKSLGREQTQINSGEDVSVVEYVDEEQVYEEIEEKYGFYPVRLEWLPEGIEFIEASASEEIQETSLFFGQDDSVNVVYRIRPNYRQGSYGQDIEDQVLENYEKIINNVVFSITKYRVENETYRWAVKFEYKNVTYFMLIMNVNEKEIRGIIDNLYFV